MAKQSFDAQFDWNARGSEEPDMFDLVGTVRSVWDAIRFNINLILVAVAIMLALALTYHLVWPPVYTTQALLMVERSDDPLRDEFYGDWNVFRKVDTNTEMGLIGSGTVITRVVEKENLTYDDVYHPLMSQLRYFWQESWLGRTYKSIKEAILGPSESELLLTEEEAELGKTVNDLKSAMDVELAGDALLASIHTKGPSARITDITNTWIDTYLEWRQEQGAMEARNALQSLDYQLDRVHAEIQETSEKRVEFLRQNDLVFDLNRETMQLEKLVELESAIAAAERRIDVIDSSLLDVRNQLQSEPEERVVSSIIELNDLRETAKQKRLELESTLIRDRYRFRADSPEITRLEAQIADLDALIENNPETLERGKTVSTNPVRAELLMRQSSLRTEREGLVAELDSMVEQLDEMNRTLNAAPALLAELRDLDRRYAVAQESYQVLLTKRSQAAVSLVAQENSSPAIRVVDYAAPVSGKSWPTAKILYPGALILGILIGIGAAIIKHLFSNRIFARHLHESKSGVPLLETLDMNDSLIQSVAKGAQQPSATVMAARARIFGKLPQ